MLTSITLLRMHLDRHGLPMQKDGDRNDQLQRVGMIGVAEALGEAHEYDGRAPKLALQKDLQPRPGIFTRYKGGDPGNVSADQLIPVLAYFILTVRRQAWRMLATCLLRFGFAQNYKDGLDGSSRTKIPDFMLIRALPLFARLTILFYPLALVIDLLLVINALLQAGPVFRDDKLLPTRRSPDDVDDNNVIVTLIVCRARMPTPFSVLAAKIYSALRPPNHGCKPGTGVSNVCGALRWYHRPESGGNPDIAAMYERLVAKFL